MSAAAAAERILAEIAAASGDVAAFRATVTAVNGNLVAIKRIGEATGSDEQYASLTRFPLYVNDVVFCVPMGGKPVIVDVIRRAAAATPAIAANAAAGSTASVAITGRDDVMQVQVIPGGTGIATGSILTVTFAAAVGSASYDVLVSPNTSAARTLAGVVGVTSRGTTSFDLATATALTSGLTYQWGLLVRQYA